MNFTFFIKSVAIVSAVVFSTTSFAYTPEMKKKVCKKPKYREFSLPEYKAPDYVQVSPESEFTFTLSSWADLDTLKVTAKKEALPFTAQTTSTYHRIKVKLPARFNGQYVRIGATVKADLGCDDQTGWLIKVADKKTVPATGSTESAPAATAPVEPAAPTGDDTKSPPTESAPSPQ